RPPAAAARAQAAHDPTRGAPIPRLPADAPAARARTAPLSVGIDWLPLARLEELQAFVDEHWRRGHVLARDAELLRWQHRRREDPGRLAVLVAEEDGRLAGMLGFVEVDVCVGDQRAAGGWMTTWLVVPEARGRGLGLALVDRVLGSEYELVGALAANDATR